MRRVLLVLVACSAPPKPSPPPPSPTPVVVVADAAVVVEVTPDAAEQRRVVVTESDPCGLVVDNVYFESNAAMPGKPQQQIIDSLAEMFKCFDQLGTPMLWEVQGHVDELETSGQTLSEVRAQYVHDALVLRGVNPLDLRAVGYGATQPLDRRHTDFARAKNRRVSFLSLGKRP